MPIQHPQKIPAMLPGAKRRRVGGKLRRVGPNPKIQQQPKGSFHAPVPLVVDSRPPLESRPLSEIAWKLLVEFYRRVAFYEAIEDGLSADDAGQTIGLGRTASYELLKEIRRHGSPDLWLITQAIAGMERGEIARGRATKRSKRAEAFFSTIGGASTGRLYWRNVFACRTRIDLGELDRDRSKVHKGLSEALDYWVHQGLLWEAE